MLIHHICNYRYLILGGSLNPHLHIKALEPLFNVSRLKVFPQLLFRVSDTKSVMLVLNFIHLRYYSVCVQIHCSPKKRYVEIFLYQFCLFFSTLGLVTFYYSCIQNILQCTSDLYDMYQVILTKSRSLITNWPLTGASLVKYKHLYTCSFYISSRFPWLFPNFGESNKYYF
jgi:hypothetical protein